MSDVANTKSLPIRGWKWWVRDLLAFLIWSIVLVGPFVSRYVDGAVLDQVGNALTIEHISIGVFVVLGLSWLIGLRIMWHVAFVAAYPLIVPLRILPKLCARHWPLLFVFLPGIRGLVRGMRIRSGLLFIAFAAAVGAFSFAAPSMLLSCWVILCGYLLWIFAHQLHLAYRPVTAYSELVEILQRVSTWLPSPRVLVAQLKKQSPRKTESKTTPEQSRAANLFVLYGVSTCLQYVAGHLDALQRSFKLDIYLVYCVLKTFILTVVTFAVIFASMGATDSQHFKTEGSVNLVDYLMFSFCNVMTSDTSGVQAMSRIAKVFACTEQFFAFGLLVLVVFVIFTSLRERHRTDLQLVVTKFQAASSAISNVFESDFELTRSAVEGIVLGFAPVIAKHLIAIHHGKAYAERLYEENKRTTSSSPVTVDAKGIEAETIEVPQDKPSSPPQTKSQHSKGRTKPKN